MKLYEVGYGNNSIKEVESERQTEHSVFINGNRYNWRSQWNKFFRTKQEAVAHCSVYLETSIANHKSRAINLQHDLDKIKKYADENSN